MRNKVESGSPHREACRREDIGLNDVGSGHGKTQPGFGGFAAVRVDDMLAFLVRARRSHRQTAREDHARDLIAFDRVSDSDPPWAPFGISTASLYVAAGVNEVIAVPVAVEDRAGTVDRPTFDQARWV